MTTDDKTFTLGAVLSVTTGRLLCSMGEVYEILNHLTGDSLFTHQLPRASREAAPVLLERFPQLADVEVPESLLGEDAVSDWLDSVTPSLGSEFLVAPMAPQEHTSIDPISEFRMLRPDADIIPVVVEP